MKGARCEVKSERNEVKGERCKMESRGSRGKYQKEKINVHPNRHVYIIGG